MIERPKRVHEPVSVREPIVFIIDDDPSVRRALTNLFQSHCVSPGTDLRSVILVYYRLQ